MLLKVSGDHFSARGHNRMDSGSCCRPNALSHNAADDTRSVPHDDLRNNLSTLAQLSGGAQEPNADSAPSTCRLNK